MIQYQTVSLKNLLIATKSISSYNSNVWKTSSKFSARLITSVLPSEISNTAKLGKINGGFITKEYDPQLLITIASL